MNINFMNNGNMARLSANENCYGCSPAAVAAAHDTFCHFSVYPEVTPTLLRQKLAFRSGLEAENIVIGAGSVRLIDGLIQTFVKDGQEVLTFDNTFGIYKQLTNFYGHTCIEAPLTNRRCLPYNLLPLLNANTRMIFISNPNNPTGTIITQHELSEFMQRIPQNVMVVIDEAYAEYVTDRAFPDTLKLQKQYPNLVILRTFSKIYGLAGLRLGYALMSTADARQMHQAQIPFAVNYFAAAAATAALEDEGFIRRSAAANAIQRQYLCNSLSALGYDVTPSHANFVYIEFSASHDKKELKDLLFQNNILVCDLEMFGNKRALRITVGKPDVNQKIVSLLRRQTMVMAS